MARKFKNFTKFFSPIAQKMTVFMWEKLLI